MNMFERRQFLQLGAAMAVGACAPKTVALTGVGPVTNFDWKLYPPESAGMSESGLEGIRAAIQKNIDAKTISGAVTAVARNNKLVWHEAQGLADIEGNRAMQTDSIFRMASSTKVVTAVAALMLVEEGRLALEDPVSKFIPTFKNQRVAINPAGNKDPAKVTYEPANRDITIKDLLTHTSGLSSLGDLTGPGPGSLVNTIDREVNDQLADYIPQLGGYALDFQPGSKWRYSALDGIDTVLYLVELVSGMPADQFVKERIFQPLDMRSSYFKLPESEMNRLVKVYAQKEGKLVAGAPILGIVDLFPYVSGGGGMLSTAHDMLNFELMLLNKGTFNGRRLLKPETVAMMSTNQVGTLFAEWIPIITGGKGFGLGVGIVEDESRAEGRSAGSFGWGGAYGTESWADPKLNLAAVLLIQMSPSTPDANRDFSQAIKAATVA